MTGERSTDGGGRRKVRCAIYTRKSSEEGLEQEFNSLHAQREACEAYIASQKHEGWVLLKEQYDDGGLSGGNMARPALQRLLDAVDDGLIDQIVVYKVDRLTRSLPDFSRLIERLDKAEASFVSVTQSFNTATSMGRLTLNVLLSFAQFEREVTAERIRDKIAASKKKGMWMGGPIPLGYYVKDRSLIIREDEADIVRRIYDLYLTHGTVRQTKAAADKLGLRSRSWTTKTGLERGGVCFTRGHIYRILSNPIYVGMVHHKGQTYDGQHEGIIDPNRWQQVQAQLKIGETRNPNKIDQTGKRSTESKAATSVDGTEEQDEPDLNCTGQSEADATTAHGRLDVPPKTPVPSPSRSKRPYRTEPSPLVGKAFDESGDRLTPSHANKKGRRYRYYVSNRLIARSGEQESTDPSDSSINEDTDGEAKTNTKTGNDTAAVINGWRLPATTLEGAVSDAVAAWLEKDTLPATLVEFASADEQIHIQQQIRTLIKQFEQDDRPIVQTAQLIQRIDLAEGNLTIQVDAKAIANLIDIATSRIAPEAIKLTIPFIRRKRGVETKLIMGQSTQQLDTTLIRNLAQARSWYEDLKSGSSLATIAKANDTSVTLVSRILPMAFLSPSIVETICTGQQPPELTSRKMRDIGIPDDWIEQAQLFRLT